MFVTMLEITTLVVVIPIMYISYRVGVRSIYEMTSRSGWMGGFQVSNSSSLGDYFREITEERGKPHADHVFFDHISPWEISKDGVDFRIAPYSTGRKHSSYLFRVDFVFPDDIRARLRLRIRKRGRLERIFGKNRGQFHHIDPDLAIYSSNVLVVRHLMEGRKNRIRLLNLLDKCGELDVGGKNTIITSPGISAMVDACNSVFPLVAILREEMPTERKDTHYEIIEVLADYNVNSAGLSCIICYQLVVIEEALVTDCCLSVVHADHIKTWLKSHRECPYCRKKVNVLLDPVRQKAHVQPRDRVGSW